MPIFDKLFLGFGFVALVGCSGALPTKNPEVSGSREARNIIDKNLEKIYREIDSSGVERAFVVANAETISIIPHVGAEVTNTEFDDATNSLDPGSTHCAEYWKVTSHTQPRWRPCDEIKADLSSNAKISGLERRIRILQSRLNSIETQQNQSIAQIEDQFAALEVVVRELREDINNGSLLTQEVVDTIVAKLDQLKARIDAGIPNYNN